jgi:hypothetical protein
MDRHLDLDGKAPPRLNSPSQGLTRSEKRELRDRGFSEEDIQFLNVLREIDQWVREERGHRSWGNRSTIRSER